MGAEHHTFEIDAAASLIGWWRDAGVDVAVAEAPHNWLGAAAAVQPVATGPVAPVIEPLPATLDAFVAWLMQADLPEAGPPRRRLAPTGAKGAALMVLADFPDAADVDAGLLLAGPLAPLFDKMVAAVGHDRSSVYVATLCPGRPLSGRLSPDSLPELARIAKHHVALVAPAQLWLMGSAASRAILGVDDASARGTLHSVNLDGRMVRTIATAHPRLFEDSKARKSAAWTEMQRLIAKDDA